MKKILLATAASITLSLPAMAQSGMQPSQNEPTHSQTQPQSQMQQQPAASETQQQPATTGVQQHSASEQTQATEQQINPEHLSKDQISQIQEALNKKGFDAKGVDGIWGPNTEAALRDFQEQNKLGAEGQLTHETLAELGLNWAGQQGTVGAAPNSGAGSTQTSPDTQNKPEQNEPSTGSPASENPPPAPSAPSSGSSGQQQ